MVHPRKLLTLGLPALGATLSLIWGCSSSKSPSPDAAATNPTSCAKNDLEVVFAPMYSAYDGTHTFQVPAVVQGVAASAITWSASDATMVNLAPDADTGGVMITTAKAGTVTIIASAGGLCGSSLLTIAPAVEADWEAGSARYNSGVVLPGRGILGGGPGAGGAGGASMEYACTNCHGDTATAGPYKTVSHTPEQTGGFSDTDLTNIFRNGAFPKGATDPNFDSSIVSYDQWSGFHKWSMSDSEAQGVIVYLRSLTPQAQTGAPNFGGRYDGGVMGRDGGAMRPDGGFGVGGNGGPGPRGGGGAGGRSMGGGPGGTTGSGTGGSGTGGSGTGGTATGVGGAGVGGAGGSA